MSERLTDERRREIRALNLGTAITYADKAGKYRRAARDLLAELERVEADRDSWKATAEVSQDESALTQLLAVADEDLRQAEAALARERERAEVLRQALAAIVDQRSYVGDDATAEELNAELPHEIAGAALAAVPSERVSL